MAPTDKTGLAWTVTASRVIIRDRWIDLRADDCVAPNGVAIAPFYVLTYPDWVHVVCSDAAGRIALIRQYRHGIGSTILELPGGMIVAQETRLQAAQRELREETGITARDWRASGMLSVNPATHTNRIHIYACVLASVAAPSPDRSEQIETVFMTRAELQKAIASGDFANSMHLAGLTLAFGLGG